MSIMQSKYEPHLLKEQKYVSFTFHIQYINNIFTSYLLTLDKNSSIYLSDNPNQDPHSEQFSHWMRVNRARVQFSSYGRLFEEQQDTRGGKQAAAHALIPEARACLLPLALGAPELALVHAVHFPALLIIRAWSPPWAARRPASCRQSHVLLWKQFILQIKF